MIDLNKLKVKIFLDTANLQAIKTSLQKYPFIKGFTTNPSLMHKEGVKNYEQYCKEALRISSNLPISFEVFSDDIKKMEDEARIINSWGGNSYVKIPITNTKGISTKEVINNLNKDDADTKEKLEILFRKRSNLINKASNKINAFLQDFKAEDLSKISHTLVYCAPGDIEMIVKSISDLGVKVSKFN